MKNLMLAMIEDLTPYPIEEINKAFTQWRRTNPNIPAPANILKIIHDNFKHEKSAEKRLSDFDGNWKEYSAYLVEKIK